MTKKLVKHGNSLALVIEKPILKMMGVNEESELDIILENRTLVIRCAQEKPSSLSAKERKERIKEIAEGIMDRYDPLFKKLSKT